LIRIVIVFGFNPIANFYFNKKSHPTSGGINDEGFFLHALYLLESFDAEHFLYVSRNGYTNEKNHAFFPGFPYILSCLRSLSQFLGIHEVFLGFAWQMTLGCLNCVFIYLLGLKLYKGERAEQIGFRAA